MCAKVNMKFLEFLKEIGNDLITPTPDFGFPGLKDNDSWCVCAASYAQAIEVGLACQIYLRKTNEKTLELIPLEILKNMLLTSTNLESSYFFS